MKVNMFVVVNTLKIIILINSSLNKSQPKMLSTICLIYLKYLYQGTSCTEKKRKKNNLEILRVV